MVAMAILIAISVPISLVKIAKARDYDAEINAIARQVELYQSKAAELQQQADSLSGALARLAAEQATIQSQIDLSQAKKEQLDGQILETEAKIAQNKRVTGEIIADIATGDSLSAIEQVAGSQNIAELIDERANQVTVRDSLKKSTDETLRLQAELKTQKAEVERVLVDQQNQRQALVAKQNEQQQLLAQTQGQEAAYQQLSSQKNAEISILRSQQAAELAARARSYGGGYSSLPGDGSKGGYPSLWANAPMNAYVDDWGMYSRQCVSYAAFRVQRAYGNMPWWGGVGNANQWPGNARAAGIRTSSTPAAGTVGVVSSGVYGHVAWVESVNADGTINISHYNVGWMGDYSEWYNLDASYFDTYIYFGG